jgi:hypothetical protein
MPISFDAPNGQWVGQTLMAIRKAFRKLDDEPLRDAKLLTGLFIDSVDTRIRHGLGYPIRGYVLARSSGVVVFDGAIPEKIDPTNFVSLRASAPVTGASLLVF